MADIEPGSSGVACLGADPATGERTVAVKSERHPSFEAQRLWMASLRPRTAHIELIFNGGDDGHPLVEQLAHLRSTRTVGVGPGNGYERRRLMAVTRRFAYDREIIRALERLGGFFSDAANSEPRTELGDVDVVFLDKQGKVLGATIAHEGMIRVSDGSCLVELSS